VQSGHLQQDETFGPASAFLRIFERYKKWKHAEGIGSRGVLRRGGSRGVSHFP
jgi:hypothetical protein